MIVTYMEDAAFVQQRTAMYARHSYDSSGGLVCWSNYILTKETSNTKMIMLGVTL